MLILGLFWDCKIMPNLSRLSSMSTIVPMFSFSLLWYFIVINAITLSPVEMATIYQNNVVWTVPLETFHSILSNNSQSDFMASLQHGLNQFLNLLIPYKENDSTDYFILKNVTRTIATLNKMKAENSSANISNMNLSQIWISIVASNNNIEQVVSKLLKIAEEANSIHSNTLSTILLDFQDQQVTPLALAHFRHQISIFGYSVGKALSTGIILTWHACAQSEVHLNQLIPSNTDVLLFNFSTFKDLPKCHGTKGRSKKTSSYDIYHGQCFDHGVSGAKLGFIRPCDLNINRTSELFSVKDLDIESFDHTLGLYYSGEYLVVSDLNKHHTISKQTNITNSMDYISWLQEPVLFSKVYMGVSLLKLNAKLDNSYNDMAEKIHNLVRKAIVPEVVSNENLTYALLDTLANIKLNVSQKQRQVCTSYLCQKQIPMTILLPGIWRYKENFTFEDVKLSILKTVRMAVIANSIYPGTVETVLLDVKSYTIVKEISLKKIWIKQFRNVRDVTLANHIKFGIVIDIANCSEILSAKPDTNVTHNTIDFVVLKSDIYLNNMDSCIYKECSISEINAEIWSCLHLWENVYKKTEILSRAELALHIEIKGCQEVLTQNGIAKLIKVWDDLNSWAEEQQIPIYVGPVIDDALENSFCGWWTQYIQPDGNLLYLDKKQVALEMYKRSHPSLFPSENRTIPESVYNNNIVVISVLCVLVALIAVVIVVFLLIFRFQSKFILSMEEANKFFKGTGKHVNTNTIGTCDINSYELGNVLNQPYEQSIYELSKESFIVYPSQLLGKGQFGLICRGTVNLEQKGLSIDVAVKMTRDQLSCEKTANIANLKGIMSEIKILSYLGEHPNIVSLIGAYTKDLRKGNAYVFLELCKMGSLEKHLRSYNKNLVTIKPGTLNEEMVQDLLRWAREICCGMHFLVTKNVVHGDLATRNILLNSDKVAKIADFGLSRRLYEYTNYVKKQQEPLPWRWMPSESLTRLVFNEKTDVWAFGVTLWEMFTLGDQPYPGLRCDINFASKLEKGLRLTEPTYNEKNIYQIMCACWNLDSELRPTFANLQTMLAENSSDLSYEYELL